MATNPYLRQKIPTSLTSVKTTLSYGIPSGATNTPQSKRNQNARDKARGSGHSTIDKEVHPLKSDVEQRKKQKKAWAVNKKAIADINNQAQSNPGDGSESSAGDGITTGEDAGTDSLSNDGSSDGSDSDSGSSSGSSSGAISPLLQGSMTFEELVGEICNGIDLIFVCKRSTVVVTDYAGIYAEAKYLRDNYHSSVEAEDMALWQLEDGTYELDVSEYGFYTEVKVHYKNGTVTESYEDLVRVFGHVTAEYTDKSINKTTAIMKAKAYLAAHVRDFDMSVKANLLHDADIDIGDIVTLENPMTMRDTYRKDKYHRDPEYFFVMGNSISWDGNGPILNSIELRYGAKSPNKKEVPEMGASYSSSDSSSNSSNGDIDKAIDEVGKLAKKISYSGACQTHDCVQEKKTGDCHGMSDYIACELESRGVSTQIREYAASASNHRSVLYKDASGEWKRFPYRKYGVNYWFRDTDGVTKGRNINKTC